MTRNSPPRRRLFAQVLEAREGPSSLVDSLTVVGDASALLRALTPVANMNNNNAFTGAAPVITAAKAVNGAEGKVTISGNVIDDVSPVGLVVTIKGDGVNLTAVVDSSERFNVAFQRPTTNDFVVVASVTDAAGNVSQPVYILVSGT